MPSPFGLAVHGDRSYMDKGRDRREVRGGRTEREKEREEKEGKEEESGRGMG